MSLSGDLQGRLNVLSQQSDDDFDLLEACFVASKILRPSQKISLFREEMDKIAHQLHQNYKQQLTFHPPLNAKIKALQITMIDERGFHGDDEAFDDLEHMNLFNVLESGCGTALSLSIVFVHCARALGWAASALSFPGYSLIRFDEGAERRIIDPFQNCIELDAYDLRQLIKVIGGAEAELSPGFYESLTSKTLAMRHINAIKLHFMRCERMTQALEILQVQTGLEPQSASFWRETGLLQARVSQIDEALLSLQKSIDLSQDLDAIRHTRHIMEDLQKKLRT